MIIYILWVLVFVGFICFIALIKNNIVHSNTTRANKYIFEQENWRELLEIHRPSDRYMANFFNPLKWTYKQMFREI